MWNYLTNYSHIHIVLNHLPSVGTFFGVTLFVYALWIKNLHLQVLSYVTFLVMALLVIPTVITGNAAAQALGEIPDINAAMIELHRNSALVAFCFLVLTGTLSWLALWQHRRFGAPSRWLVLSVLVLGFITLYLMVETGDLGGEIRHSEIRAVGAPEIVPPPAGQEGLGRWLSDFFMARAWPFPLCETLHFIGLCLLFGVVLLINSRLLGLLKVPFSTIHRYLPLGVLGWGITAISGILMFNSNVPVYAAVPAFFIKMFLVVIAGLSVLYVTVFDHPWLLSDTDATTGFDKFFAVTTTLLWLGIMYIGRMLPYLGSGN